METKVINENITRVINENTNANSFSFRWGKTGTDVKIYFEGEEDLTNKLKAVIKAVIIVKDNFKQEGEN